MGYSVLLSNKYILGFEIEWGELFKQCEWLPEIVAILIVIYLMILIIKAIKAEEISFFNFNIKGKSRNVKMEEDLKKAYKNWELLNSEAELKWSILMNVWTIIMAITDLMLSNDLIKIKNTKDRLLSHILICLGNVLMIKEKDNVHKASIYIPAEGNKLKLQYGPAFNPTASIEFDIDDSAVGWSYRTGKIYKCDDVTQDRIYKKIDGELFNYRSLVCMNIEKGGDKWGTLCVDGTKISSISEDDITYIKIFASLVTMIFLIVDRKEAKGEVAVENKKTSETVTN